jgi:hypothetical protein
MGEWDVLRRWELLFGGILAVTADRQATDGRTDRPCGRRPVEDVKDTRIGADVDPSLLIPPPGHTPITMAITRGNDWRHVYKLVQTKKT